MGNNNLMLWFDDQNEDFEFSIKLDEQSGYYYYSIEDTKLTEI